MSKVALNAEVTYLKTGGCMVRNLLLKFTVEMLLNQANPDGLPYFRTTHFNKMLFIIYKRLLEKGIDIKLPYCWYRFGTLVDANTFGSEVGTPLWTYAPYNSQTIPFHDLSRIDIPQREKEIIISEIADVIGIYGYSFNRYNLDKLKEDDYSYAPFEFQKLFNRGFVLKVVELASGTNDAIEDGLDSLIKSFPYDEMSELCDVFLEWEDSARLALDSDIKLLPTLTRDFCKIFCYLLRVKKNENINGEVVQIWHNDFLTELPDYHESLETNRECLLGEYSTKRSVVSSTKDIVNEMNKIAFML